MSCSNNLKQIGLALHNHHDTMGFFPPSATNASFNPGWGPTQGWGQFLLSYIEQGNMANLYRWDRNWFAPENQQVVTVPVKTFLCPSAPGQRKDAAPPSTVPAGPW